jgi:hypothetical protein
MCPARKTSTELRACLAALLGGAGAGGMAERAAHAKWVVGGMLACDTTAQTKIVHTDAQQ